jgi:ubiquitin carboxyl-terminal hydrolase 6/32
VIHLKRFDFVNGRWMKSDKMVNFPLEDLHLTARMLKICGKHNVRNEASTQCGGDALRGAHQWQRVEGK